MPRLFVAVWPPGDVVERVARLRRPATAGLKWTAPEQWHVTLRFLGHVDDAAPVGSALVAATGEVAATEAVLGPAVGRFGMRVLHVPIAGLDEVAAAVVSGTAHLGRPPEDRSFSGHMTLGRVAKGAKVDLRALAGEAVHGRWHVTEVCLVESHLSPKGPRYQVLERFPLA